MTAPGGYGMIGGPRDDDEADGIQRLSTQANGPAIAADVDALKCILNSNRGSHTTLKHLMAIIKDTECTYVAVQALIVKVPTCMLPAVCSRLYLEASMVYEGALGQVTTPEWKVTSHT